MLAWIAVPTFAADVIDLTKGEAEVDLGQTGVVVVTPEGEIALEDLAGLVEKAAATGKRKHKPIRARMYYDQSLTQWYTSADGGGPLATCTSTDGVWACWATLLDLPREGAAIVDADTDPASVLLRTAVGDVPLDELFDLTNPRGSTRIDGSGDRVELSDADTGKPWASCVFERGTWSCAPI